MMPYNEIEIGNIYSNPLYRGYGKYNGLEWHVIDKKERMIKVQGISFYSIETVGKPIWKDPTDRMFSESWRIK